MHALIASKYDSDYGKFIVIGNDQIVGNDGIISAGARAPVSEAFAPEGDLFKLSLQRAGERYTLSLMPPNVVVSSDQGRFVVPCREIGTIPGAGPDHGQYPASERMIAALYEPAMIVSEKSESYGSAAIYCEDGFVYGTNGLDIIRSWHDSRLPPVEIPKEFLIACAKVKDHKATHIGFGQSSVTMWFGNDRWVRSKRHTGMLSQIKDVFENAMVGMSAASYTYHIEQGLAYELEKLKPYVVNDRIWLYASGIMTQEDGSGASVQFAHNLPMREYRYAGLLRAALFGNKMRFSASDFAWINQTMVAVGGLPNVD